MSLVSTYRVHSVKTRIARIALTGLLLALLPLSSLAETELSLGPCVSVQAVHGSEQKVASGEALTLANGTRQLVVECTTEIGREEVLETSDAFVLKFEAANAGLVLTAPEIRSRREMELFNQQGNWQLSDDQGQPVPFTADVLHKEGFQLARDYSRELQTYNRSDGVAVVSVASADSPGLAPETNRGGLLLSSQGDPDQEMVSRMLRYWYLKADEKTRREWQSWVDSSNR